MLLAVIRVMAKHMFQAKWLIAAIIVAVMGALVLSTITKKIREFQNEAESSLEKPFQINSVNEISMKITSGAFEEGGLIPAQFTCDGADVNPPLVISEVPETVKSLVLIMEDSDVPTNIREDGMWDHWIVFNIPPSTSAIAQESEPVGVYGIGTSGDTKYHGPCPPDGEHRYFFRLYALDRMLELDESVSRKEVENAMSGHIIEEAKLQGRYSRGNNYID